MVLPEDPSIELLRDLLSGGGPDEELFRSAHLKLLEEMGGRVYLRGLVEISNNCRKNCFYCGLRRDNASIDRYSMRPMEIMGSLRRGYRLGLRSFLLQSGELLGEEHLEMVAGILRSCSSTMPGARMVLSLGELPEEIYDRLRIAGGHRYLLRIETSSPVLYGHFHPDDPLHSHGARLRALEYLRDSGWQTGTGVLIGLPGQTVEDLAEDILFMKRMDMDMVGMGPYIESPGTPLLERADEIFPAETRILLTLRMIALTRLALPGVNIAATTALQTLSVSGLERGLLAGANVVMPNLTPERYRESYNLYTGKTRVRDTPSEMIDDLRDRCLAIGRELSLYDPGDPPHFKERTGRGESPDDDR
ncbi:MAG: [FeFe] hydrogenase H-cluster radical SAM maturase HydE [Candidatus Fermentibacteraceae bacterium]|nr:[FeFe] hydrogenase H-cluster radical SAM maturase HydE [Candidatus Fermentibacteraceae bacterium]MBN2607482.1 [FeFe] hydrogenase H-cluster radical SAM maturase HydE [Candidatus Fermentibacteraceae bacterium]